MTEVDTEEKSEESTSEPEQIEKEETDEIVPAENSETDVIDNAGDTTPDTSSEKKGSSEKTPEGDADAEISSGEINAAEATEASVDFKTLVDDVDDENKPILSSGDASDAEITYTNGCVNNGKLVAGKDLTFKIEPGAGRVLLKWGYVLSGDTSQDPKADKDAHAGQEESIPNGTLLPKGKAAQSVTIYVKTAAAGYKVKFADGTGTAFSDETTLKIYEVVTEEGANKGKLAAATVTTTGGITVPQGESKEFALGLVDEDKILDEDGIKLNGQVIEFESLKEDYEQVGAAAGTKIEAYPFTVDPSAYGLDSNAADTAAEVKITVRDAYALTVPAISVTNATMKTHSGEDSANEKFVKADASTGAFVVTDLKEGNEENYNKTKIAFAVLPNENYKIKSVTAKVKKTGTDGDGEEVECVLADVPEAGDNKGLHEYTIALNQDALALDANKTLTISIETEVDDAETNDEVHKITFDTMDEASDLNNVTITGTPAGGSKEDIKNPAEKTVRTLAGSYTVKVAAKPGYALTKGKAGEGGNLTADETSLNGKAFITIAETRQYEGVDEKKTVARKEEVDEENGMTIDFTEQTPGDNKYTTEAGAASKKYTVLSAVVKVGVAINKNDDEKLIAFDNKIKDEGAVVAITNKEGVYKDQYPQLAYDALKDDTYTVADSVDLLTFTVTSAAVTPKVTLSTWDDENDSAVTEELEGVTTEGSGVYTYSVPASILSKNVAKLNKITIEKKVGIAKNVMIKVDKSTNIASLTAKVESGADTDKTLTAGENQTTTLSNLAQVGQKVKLVFTAAENVTFGEITAKMGETSLTAVIGTDEATHRATATIETTVTDAISIEVKTVSPYYVVLTGAGEKDENGAYSVDYNATNIGIDLKSAGTNVDAAFYDIAVKDGSATAVTTAKLDGTKKHATIEKIDPAEWGKTLTIEVQRTKYKTDKYTATLVVSANSDEVTVTNVATNAAIPETGIEVMRDDSFKIRVTPKAGATKNDLKLMFCDADGKKDTKAEALFENGASLTLNPNNEVEIKAVAAAAAYDGDVYLGVFNDRKDAEGKDQTAPLKGGLVKIKVLDPVVLSSAITEVKVTSGDSAKKDSNKSIGINMNLGLAKNAKVKIPLDNNLYYKVEVDGITGTASEGELKTVDKITEYLPITKAWTTSDGLYYDASAFAMYQEYCLVKSYKPAGAKTAFDEESEYFWSLNIPGTITANVKVTLVQGVDGDLDPYTNDAKKYAAGKDASASFTTKQPIYETKLGVTKMNNATVFTGQKAVVAMPKFTATTSKNYVEAQLINAKTGKILGTSWRNISTGVYENGSVWVQATTSVYPKLLQTSSDATVKDNFKNLAVKITASQPVINEEGKERSEGYAATAVLKIKVQQGIYNIDAEQGKAALSNTLYQDAKGNVKAVTIKPRYNGGYSDYKPAKAKVTWAITGMNGTPISNLDPHMQDAVTGKKPLITVKNGKITVNKAYKRAATKTNTDADTFYVTATADDFTADDQRSGSQKSKTWAFTITGANQTIGSLVVVDEYNKPVDAASLTAEDFKNKTLSVAAVKTGAEPDKISGRYDSNTDFIPATFKVSGKLIQLTGNGATKRGISFLKPGTTKITATTVDGGKGSGTKAELSVTVVNALMGLEFTSAEGSKTDANVTAIDYYGGSNMRYTINLKYYDTTAKVWKYENSYKNVKVAVKGGKLFLNKGWAKTASSYNNTGSAMGSAVVVTDKKGVATITLTDTVTKKVIETYTITNKSNMSVKAPTVKVAKIVDSDGKVQRKVDRNSRNLTFQVTTSDKKLENYAGKYIKLTPDYTVDSTKNRAYYFLGSGVIEKIDENGQFTKDLDFYDVQSNYAYKMVATVGDIKDGEFVAAAKDAKVSFNVSSKKYNDTLKIGAKYVLDAQGTPRVPISVTTGKGYYVSEAKNIIKKDKDQKANDHMNHFADYFQVWDNWEDDPDGGEGNYKLLYNKDNYGGYYDVYEEAYATIGLRTDLTAEQIKYITGQDPATAKAAKADCEGYITVWNGTYRKDVKITVSFNKKGVKFTAAADPVYASSKAVEIPVKIMNGKQEVRVNEVVVDGTSAVVDKITKVGDRAVIKTVKDLKAGTYEINLRVQPEDAAYNGNTKDKADDKNKIQDVTKTYGVPVTLKLEVKDLADVKILNIGKNPKYSLSSLKYNGSIVGADVTLGNGYAVGDKPGDPGYYMVDVPYTLAATNALLKNNDSKNTYVKVDLDEKLIKPDSKKPALVQAEVIFDDGDKGVLQIRVAKQLIETCDKMAKKDKPLTGWNKDLKVPVTIQPVNAAGDKGAAQTVTITLKTPKAPATFAQVQEKIKAAGLDKIQTPKSTNAITLMSSLLNKVEAKLQTIVAADADVEIISVTYAGEKPENGAASTDESDIVREGKAVFTIKVQDFSKTGTEPVEIPVTYNFALHESSGDVYTITNAIETKSDWKFTNETTEKDLLDEIRKIPAVRNILMTQDEGAETYSKKTRKDNISMKVTSFTKKAASTQTGSMTGAAAGSITAKVTVTDLVTGYSDDADVNVTIKTLTNIVDAYNVIKIKFDTADVVEGIFKDCAGDKTAIVAELDKIAKEEVKKIMATSNNANLKVEVPEASVVVVKPVKAVAGSGREGQEGYVAPVEAVAGKLSFKVTLTEGTRVKNYSKTITIDSDEGDKYVDLTKATEKVTTTVKGTKADGTTDADWAKQIDGTLKTAITTVTAGADFADKTDAQKKSAIAAAIKTSLEGGVLNGSTATGIYGYKAEVSVTDYKAASKEQEEVVTFTVTVKPKAGDGSGNDVTVTGAVLNPKAPTKMTKAELQAALNGYTKVQIANTFADASAKTTLLGNIKAKVETDIKALMPDSQAGELADATITVDVTNVTFDETAGEDEGSGTITAIKGVKVTVKDSEDENVIPEKTYTSITVEAPAAP